MIKRIGSRTIAGVCAAIVVCSICLKARAVAIEVLASRLDEIAVGEEFNSAAAWQAQPGWLSAPSSQADVTVDRGVACFQVPEPGRGMKWSRSTPGLSLEEMPYLAVRYRAENVDAQGDDYFVFLDDGGTRQCHALRKADLVADGKWHTVAVNARRLALKPEIGALALQITANRSGPARLWVDWLMFSADVPEGAAELTGKPLAPATKDWDAPLSTTVWTAQPSWLADPCASPETSRPGKETIFQVKEAGRGMKWSWNLLEPLTPEGHPFLSLRYRASNCRTVGDYAVCVLGRLADGSSDYLPAVACGDIVPDGRWHALSVDFEPIRRRFRSINGFAVQVQATGNSPAELRLERLALTNERMPRELSEFVTVRAGADLAGFAPVSLSGLYNQDTAKLRRRLRIGNAMPSGRITAEGIPFEIAGSKPDFLGSSLGGEERLAIPVQRKASEIYLLAWAAFAGPEEASRGPGRLQRISDVDRFRVELDYADGSREECLPFNLGARRFEISAGPQVLCAWADPRRELRGISLQDLTLQGAFGVSAITCRTSLDRLCAECAEETPPMRIATQNPALSASVSGRATTSLEGNRLVLRNGKLAMTLEVTPEPRVVSLINRATSRDCFAGREGTALLAIPKAKLELAGAPIVRESADSVAAEVRYRVSTMPDVEASARIELGAGAEVVFDVAFENKGKRPATFEFAGPSVGPFCLGRDLAQNFYLMPKCGAAFHCLPASYRKRYCGRDMPLQFVSVVNPSEAEGLYLRTEDTTCVWRNYNLSKSEKGVVLGVDYPSQTLAPGGVQRGVRTLFGVSGGDWRDGFEAYRRWVQSWYHPVAPRQSWFREAFNFRQRFLWSHDPLCESSTGKLDLTKVIAEAQEQFGGLEYLHLFDWGYCGKFGRIYGRTGDYSAYDFIPGGMEAFRSAIGAVQSRGVHVGLYIEGYLLEERGKLGPNPGKSWQIVGRDGKPLYWPQSTEMFMCPFADGWREVQASTYAARVSELGVDGMYVDQFGFANAGKDCFSGLHGHPVPGYTVVGERDCMKQIRDRVDGVEASVVLYGEECPCDVNSQNQDGSFTYAMSEAARTETLVPLNLLRFALPTFKTFEILVCDKPTGTWASGVKWVFFNGEGLWLEGPGAEWFAPQTLAAIRKCHAILRQHKDAFTSEAPVPLVPTEAGGVFSNLFPAAGKRIYTLFNSRHRSFTGEVLRVPHVPGARYQDEWNGRQITPRRDGEEDVVSTELEPLGVGCVAVSAPH